MRKIVFLFITLTLACGLSAQDGPRPALSKKEVRQYQRNLKKRNASLKKKTARLEKFLRKQGADSLLGERNPVGDLALTDMEMPDSLQTGEISQANALKGEVPKADSSRVRQKLKTEVNKRKQQAKSQNPEAAERLDQLQQLNSKGSAIDTTGAFSGITKEIDQLKSKLEVGSSLSGGDAKVKAKLQESVLELADIEYDLQDVEALKSQMKGLKLDSATIKKYLEPLNADVAAIQSEVAEYQSMLDGYKGELIDWDKTLEEEILKLEEVQGLAEYAQKSAIDPAKDMKEVQRTIEKGFQSTEYVKELIKKRFSKLLEEEGPDALAKRLREGHQKLAGYKKKYESLDDVRQAPKRPPNPLKGLPFKDRLVFGANLQINRQKPLTLDAGLEMAYKLTPKAELGMGGAYRFKLQKGTRPGTVTDLLNLRSFYYHNVWRSLGIQANYELNYARPVTEQAIDGLRKEWQESGLIGIRNDRPFLKKLGGYVIFQYDFLHSSGNPNPKWIFRFGFRLN